MINIKSWASAGNATITDMTNAGKRGKMCRRVRFAGECYAEGTDRSLTLEIVERLRELSESKIVKSFEEALSWLKFKIKGSGLKIYEEEIKGIRAPREELSFTLEGVWSISIDESGVSLADLADRNNEPRMITTRQSANTAYNKARKVWEEVKKAKTMSQAGNVLSEAGCQLHYYCAMD